MLIPYKAVVEQMGEYFVFAVKGNRVIQHRVTLGMNINDMVVVKDGLQPDDQIVTEGMQRLRENALVAVASAGTSQVSGTGNGK